MSRLLKLELWLFTIAGLIALAVVLAATQKMDFAGRAIPYLAAVWMVFAIVWMLRTIVRGIRG